ncbi:MAG: hypothetical protein A4E44_00040 [Methanosaeta sp. PtaB.Bin018]|nr:MAG: hypothetical protein A4E44_00040 [Methanosaeta sp. PtaB.Bin018]
MVARDAGCNPLGVSTKIRQTSTVKMASNPRLRSVRLLPVRSLPAGNIARTRR